jgi:putative nucleotidyltransferase with HDIG domain
LFLISMTYFCYLMQYPLIIPFFLFFVGFYMSFIKKAGIRKFLPLGFLLTILIVGTYFVQRAQNIPIFYIPVAGISMLTILLFSDIQVTFLMSFISSLLVTLIVHSDFSMFLTFFLGSLSGAFYVREGRNRGQLIGAGVFISLTHLICLVLLYPDFKLILTKYFALNFIYPLVFNGFIAALLVVSTLKIFELLFGVVTNFSLLELADINQPILKRMAIDAPGTWQHSLMVAQLAEVAANEIGANGLLARVGAYYHDIGKLVKPEYFTENQLMGDNKHDTIEPTLSRLVIFNHVKEGMELAKKHQLNPLIADFIPQHHGTSLMHFFYQKALEEAKDGEPVEESNFRYPGPKPQSKETAITLLADTAEGATRALDEPNPTKVEEVVKRVVNNKFIDGQLDDSGLTLKEIEKISKTFTRILSAMHHSRVKYPEKKNGHSIKKSPEKSENQSPETPEDNRPYS